MLPSSPPSTHRPLRAEPPDLVGAMPEEVSADARKITAATDLGVQILSIPLFILAGQKGKMKA